MPKVLVFPRLSMLTIAFNSDPNGQRSARKIAAAGQKPVPVAGTWGFLGDVDEKKPRNSQSCFGVLQEALDV